MAFGFLKFFLLFLIIAVVGIGAFLTLADVPVEQQEIIVNIPADAATAP